MFSQFTYQGLMDEVFSIQENRFIKFDTKLMPNLNLQKRMRENYYIIQLTNDNIFKEIKNRHNSVVTPILQQKFEEFKQIMTKKKPEGNKMDNIVETLKTQQKILSINADMENTEIHMSIRVYFDEIISKPSHFRRIKIEQNIVDGNIKLQEFLDYIEVLIARQSDFSKTMRLLCLYCLVENGIKQVHLDGIKRDILQSYGFQHILTLSNLEKVQLLKRDGEKKQWDALNKALNLINPELDLANPNDAAFAYDGYCSILVRLVEQIFKKDGWKAIENPLNLLNGPLIMDDKKLNNFGKSGIKQVILVYVVGGLTYGEIATLRWLGKHYNKEILIATTGIINGDKLINSFKEKGLAGPAKAATN
jgi:hypothetical protein